MCIRAFLWVFVTALHQIEKTNQRGIQKFVVRVPAVFLWKFAFSQCIEVARILFEIMRKFAFGCTYGTIIFIVKLSTGFLLWFRSGDFSLDIMRIMAIKSIFTIPGKIVDARIHVLGLMHLSAHLLVWTLINSKVLFGAQLAYIDKFSFEPLKLQELLVHHLSTL